MFIVVLGGGIDLKGNLPDHVYQRLDKAIELYKSRLSFRTERSEVRNLAKRNYATQSGAGFLAQARNNKVVKIVLTGKYSFLYGVNKPPTTEAEKMAQYLLSKNIPKKDFFMEKNSQDSISNAYYLKKNIFIPKNESQAVIITSHFHLERVKYIFQKILGPDYKLEFIGLQEHLPQEEEKKVLQRQKELLLKTRLLLAKMKDGDHQFLAGKFYRIKYYREERPAWVKNFVAQGK